MKLQSIRIENFRSFKNEIINFDEYTCFVGPNGTGKSTILMALNVFFRNNTAAVTDLCKLGEEDFHHKNTKEPIKISLTFVELSEEEKNEFKHYYRQGQLVFFAKAIWDEQRQGAEVKQHGSRLVMPQFAPYFEADNRGAKADELKQIYSDLRSDFPELPKETVKGRMEGALRLYEEQHEELCRPIDDEQLLYGWTKGNKLKNLPLQKNLWVSIGSGNAPRL